MRKLVSRISARIFVGQPLCRDERWLRLCVDYSIDAFTTAFVLKKFPPLIRPLAAYLLPHRYRLQREMQVAQTMIKGEIQKHKEAKEQRDQGLEVEEQDVLLHWMLDHCTEEEGRLPEMSKRQCVMTLSSVHTTSMSVTNLIFDLCTYPEWCQVLRDEVKEVETNLESTNQSTEVGATLRRWLADLQKMDSFIVESQRTNPAILCQFIPLETLGSHSLTGL